MTLTVGIIGQSNGVNMRSASYGSTLTANANLKLWDGVSAYATPTFGDGQISFGNDLITKFGGDVFMVNSAVGNTSLLAASAPIEGYWLDQTASAIDDDFKTDVTAAEGALELDFIIYWQGVRDAQEGTTSASYKQGLLDLIDQIRSDFTTPTGGTVPIIIPQLISRLGTGEIDADWRGIRQAARDSTAERTLCEYAASFLDFLLFLIHPNNH